MTRRLLPLLIAVAVLAAAPAAWATLQTDRATFRSEAAKGIAVAHTYWWDSRHSWYDSFLNDQRQYPQATVWSIVPLFEAIDARAIGSPSTKNKAAVKYFANKAERYWNGNVKPHGGYTPYPGDRNTSEQIWFDDNGWWGIAFVDAYTATHDKRYLTDAARALDFIANRGWDKKHGGVWWETHRTRKAGEALASGSALAAMLYDKTGNTSFLKTARKFISWANKHFIGQNGLYRRSDTDSTPMGYVEGPMIGANEVLCRKAGDTAACARAEFVATESLQRFGQDVNHGPQFDTIYLRWMLDYYRATGDARWYNLAYHNGLRALQNARGKHGLFLRAWNGSSITHYQAQPNMLQTHAAAIALFAWLGATPVPTG